MSIKIHKDGKWQLFPGTGVGGSTNSYTKEESDNKYALKSDVTAVSGKVDNLVTAVSGKVDTGSYLFTLNGDQVNQGDSVNVSGSGASITIDSALDVNSENPVQNKVVTSKLNYLESGLSLHGEEISYIETRVGNYELANNQKNIVSGSTQVSWQHVTEDSPLYLKTINGVSIIGNSENDNITISGGSGTVTESKPSVIVFAYIQSNEKPISEPNVTVDSEGNPSYTGEWKSISDMSDAISNKLQIWYSYATFVVGGNIVGSWSDPIPFAKDGLPGQDGRPGKDGIGVEYIYYRSNDNVIPSLPTDANSWEWDNVPENAGGWTDNPTGVDKDHQFEFVSVRTGNATNINPWSVPTLWSKYGVNGVDGDTIEYIYKLSQTATVLPTEYPDNSWEYDNPDPTKSESDVTRWQDNPPSVSESYPYCFVSIRKGQMIEVGEGDAKYNKINGNWSIPALWSKWSKDGSTPDMFYSALVNIYKRANSTPSKPVDGQYTYNFTGNTLTANEGSSLGDWTIDVPNNTADYLYQCSAYVTSNSATGVITSWSDPICIASNGANGSGQSAVYLDLDNDSPYIITDSEGNITSEQTVTTNVHMYYGTTEQNLTSLTIGGNSIGTQTANPSTKTVTITYPEGTAGITSTLTYTITATANINDDPDNSVSKSIVLNVVPVKQAKDGESPVIYTLKPSAEVIKLDANGETYTPNELSVQVIKTIGNESSSLSDNDLLEEGLTLQYKLDDNVYQQMSVGTNLSFNSFNFTSSITLNLQNEGDWSITQVIPVLRDGEKGDPGDPGQNGTNGTSPVVLSIDNDHFFIALDNNGQAIRKQSVGFNVHLYNGNEEIDADSYSLQFEHNDILVTPGVNENPLYTVVTNDNAGLNSSGKLCTFTADSNYKLAESIDNIENCIGMLKVIATKDDDPSVSASANVIIRYNAGSWLRLALDSHTIVVDSAGNCSPSTIGISVYNEYVTDSGQYSERVNEDTLGAWGYSLVCVNDNPTTSEIESVALGYNQTDDKFILTTSKLNLNYPIRIVFKANNNEVFDSETITVVRDGQNGSNGYTQQVLQIYKRSSAEPNDLPENSTYKVSDLNTNDWTAPDNWYKDIPTASSIPCYMSTAFIRFDATKTDDTVTANWSAPVKILENGTGSDGRMLYPAGIWNAVNLYTRTDTATPFVLYQPLTGTPAYYVLMADSSENIEPGTDANVWKLMESLDVAYANVMMAEMGTIGDATFYNNLMFSKNNASGSQVTDDSNVFTTDEYNITTINMDSENKPTMAINFDDGEAYFANGNISFLKSGNTIVKNIIYDISETVRTEENELLEGNVGSFTYTFYPINNVNTYIDTGVLQASNGQDKWYFVFKFSDDYTIYGDQACEFIEGVVINSGENIAHITAGVYNNNGVVVKSMKFYHQGHEDFAEIVLAPHSILKYFYHPLDQTNSDYSGEIYIQGDNYTSFEDTSSAGILYVGGAS